MKTKLNVGSGHPKGVYTNREWINIDIAAKDHIDEKECVLNMSVLDMPNDFTDKFEVVHCIHMLEHMNRNLHKEVFKQLYRVVAPGGILYLEVPDFQYIVALLHQAYTENKPEIVHIWKTSIYGKQRYNGDAHHWGFDARHLQELAKNAGFLNTRTTSDPKAMISSHYKQEPVILLIATK